MLFKRKKKNEPNFLEDLSITYDIVNNCYIITTYNENRKVRVRKSTNEGIIVDTCYKKQGRPKAR